MEKINGEILFQKMEYECTIKTKIWNLVNAESISECN